MTNLPFGMLLPIISKIKFSRPVQGDATRCEVFEYKPEMTFNKYSRMFHINYFKEFSTNEPCNVLIALGLTSVLQNFCRSLPLKKSIFKKSNKQPRNLTKL